MRRSKILFISSLLVFLIVAFLLFTGSSVLLIALSEDPYFPLGTLITWIGLIALPMSIYWGVKNFRVPKRRIHKFFSFLLKLTILLAILWVPISYGLAGNWSNTFTESVTFQGGQLAMKYFWTLSYGIPLLSLAILLINLSYSLLRTLNILQ